MPWASVGAAELCRWDGVHHTPIHPALVGRAGGPVGGYARHSQASCACMTPSPEGGADHAVCITRLLARSVQVVWWWEMLGC